MGRVLAFSELWMFARGSDLRGVADVVVAIVAVLESEKTDSLKRVDIGARLLLEAVLKCWYTHVAISS